MLTSNRSLKILFHGEGDAIKGTGHLIRAFGIANDYNHLNANQDITFYSSNSNLIKKISLQWSKMNFSPVKIAELNYLSSPSEWSENKNETFNALCTLAEQHKYDILVTDGKFPWSESQWDTLAKKYASVIAIDNTASINKRNIITIIPTDYFLDSTDKEILTGEEWIWLHPALDSELEITMEPYDAVIAMGGSDPSNLTSLAINDVANSEIKAINRVMIFVGPSNSKIQEIKSLLKLHKKIDWDVSITSPQTHATIMSSKILFGAFGLTSIEANYLGIPVVLYAHDQNSEKDINNYLSSKNRNAIKRDKWLRIPSMLQKQERKKRPEFAKSLQKLIESLNT